MNEKETLIFEVNNLCKTYISGAFRKQRSEVLKDITFSVHKGTAFGLLGISGSGKSTISSIILGLECYDKGRILYKNRDITDWCKFDRLGFSRSCQLLGQNPYENIYPDYYVQDVLTEVFRIQKSDMSLAEQEKKCLLYLDKVCLSPNILFRKATELSGGELQRVCLARCLLVEPESIILDEPTSQLDTIAQATVIALLKELKETEHLTYIFISHDIDLMHIMTDTIGVLYNGTIVETGLTKHVLNRPEHIFTKRLIEAHYSI